MSLVSSERHNFRPLRIFISSTADLVRERDTVEQVLSDIQVEGSRFETWPSSPESPLSACLSEIEECDGVILILGRRYGSLAPESDLSVTHMEYRHSCELGWPVFAFIMASEDVEPQQMSFIDEVQSGCYRGHKLSSVDELADGVRASLFKEFARLWRKTHSTPSLSPIHNPIQGELPKNPSVVYSILLESLNRKDDLAIHKLAEVCEQRFGSNRQIMGIVYVAEVNLAAYSSESDRERIERAFSFWEQQRTDDKAANAILKYNQGNALHVLGKLKEARKLHQDAIELNPSYAEAWKNLGNVMYDQGNKDEAYEYFEKALSLKPELIEGLASIAMGAMEKGNLRKASEILCSLHLDELPIAQQSHIHYWIARVCILLGDIKEAVLHASRCRELTPQEEWAWIISAQAHTYARQKDPKYLDGAIKFFRLLVTEKPYMADAWAALGYSLWAAWRDERSDKELGAEIVNAFKYAVQMGAEDDGLILDRLAHTNEGLGDTEAAEDFYKQAAKKSSSDFGCCLAEFLIREERYSEAVPIFEDVIAQGIEDSIIYNKLGLCRSRSGLLAEAIEAYQRSISLEEDYENSWFNLGGLQFNARNFVDAEKTLELALRRFPDSQYAKHARKMLGIIRGR